MDHGVISFHIGFLAGFIRFGHYLTYLIVALGMTPQYYDKMKRPSTCLNSDKQKMLQDIFTYSYKHFSSF